MAYRAELVDPETGREALLRLWTANLKVRGDVAAKHRWAYLDGPVGPAQAFLLHNGEADPVGCAGITVRELWWRDQPVRAALFADFAIDRAHRTAMPALVLQRAVKRHTESSYALSYGFPNVHAVAVFRRVGYHELAGMARYVRVLRHAPYLERRYGRPLAARIGGAVIDRAKLAVQLTRTIAPARSAALRWLGDVDTRFDRLWQETRGSWGLACRRDAAFLRWRFLRKPDERVQVAALIDRTTDAVRAYAMIGDAGGGMAQLEDLYGSLGAISDLLVLLVPALYRRGHTAISFRFLGDPRVPALLAAHGFARRDAQRAVIVQAGASCPVDPAALRDPGAWYVTDLDEDT